MEFLKNQQGNTVFLYVICLAVLTGLSAMVIDIGFISATKNQLQAQADAASLAGAQDLVQDSDKAINSAYQYAEQKPVDFIDVTVGDDNKSITVTVRKNIELYFSGPFGISNKTIEATATARIDPLNSVTGASPFGVVKQNFEFGKLYTLKNDSSDTGNFGALALGGNGASNYKNNLLYGYNEELKVGQIIETEPGNMSGPTTAAITYRISQDPSATYLTVSKNSPRLLLVPVIDGLSKNGRADAKIVGFALFFLEQCGGQGNDNYVTGRFLQMVVKGQSNTNTAYYGLYSTKLVR